MLDRKFIFENADAVKQNCVNRNLNIDVDQLVTLETERRLKAQAVQDLNTEANAKSKLIGKAADDAQRESLKEEAKQLREQKTVGQSELDQMEQQIAEIQTLIPNMAHPEAPIGEDDKSNLEIAKGKTTPRKFDFEVLDHLELGQKHDWIDFEGGARTTGAGFYFLKGDLVLLDLACSSSRSVN